MFHVPRVFDDWFHLFVHEMNQFGNLEDIRGCKLQNITPTTLIAHCAHLPKHVLDEVEDLMLLQLGVPFNIRE